MTYVDEMIGASEMDMHQRYTKIAALDAIIQEMFELAARDGIQVLVGQSDQEIGHRHQGHHRHQSHRRHQNHHKHQNHRTR